MHSKLAKETPIVEQCRCLQKNLIERWIEST